MNEMKKIIVVPDSFKGTMTSREVADIMCRAVHSIFSACETVSVPIGDGGEGTVDAFLAATRGERITKRVNGPFFEAVEADYAMLGDGETAVIEMAAAAGLPLTHGRHLVGETTTFGVGELMNDAIERGAKHIILGLGGSATNDGGCGAAEALGAVFFDENGNTIVPTGSTLSSIVRIDTTSLKKRLEGGEVTVMCDIDNPLCGERGAAAVFGPQKGADAEMVRVLDAGLLHLADIIMQDIGVSVLELPGAGAAGCMGACAAAFFGGRLMRGIDVVLDTVGFDDMLIGADAVITGEGRYDAQSLMGKVVSGLAARAKKRNVPVIVVAGSIKDDVDCAKARDMGVAAAFSIQRMPLPMDEAIKHSDEGLYRTVQNVMTLWSAAR